MGNGQHWATIDVAGPLSGLEFEMRSSGVAIITLDRPERGNALAPEMVAEIRAIWEHIRVTESIRAVVVTGTGTRHFCTGADMKITAAEGAVAASNGPLSEQVFWTARQNRVWKPVVAAVNGTVAGAGLHFLVDADIIVSRRDAQFLDTHVNVGLVGGLENIGLTKRLPFGTALRMSLQGKSFRLSAERAYALGFVDELTDPGQELDTAIEIATQIAANSPQAVALTQQALWHSLDVGYEDSLNYAWALIRLQWAHPDYVEGPRAFAERREPRWNANPDAFITR